MLATRFIHPMEYSGTYKTNSWPGYVFKEALGYTSGAHTGTDYNGGGAGNADLGWPAWAIGNGIVRYTGNLTTAGYGNTVIIEHELHPKLQAELGTTSIFSRYMHFLDIHVSVGQTVTIGQQIGRVGNSGTQWAHLHIDIWKANLGVHVRYDKDTQLQSYLDPYTFIENHLKDVGGPKMWSDYPNARELIEQIYLVVRGQKPAPEEVTSHLPGSPISTVLGFAAEAEATRRAQQDLINRLSAQLQTVQTALQNEQGKPPKEVVKEVTKIVKEPVYVNDPETHRKLDDILKLIKSVWGSLTSLHKKVGK